MIFMRAVVLAALLAHEMFSVWKLCAKGGSIEGEDLNTQDYLKLLSPEQLNS